MSVKCWTIETTTSNAVLCLKTTKQISKLAHTKWGAKRKPLITLFKATVMTKISYGSSIYGSATKATLKKLNPIQTKGLRMCTGAFKSSPNASVICESGETPLEMERDLQTMKNAIDMPQGDSPAKAIFKDKQTYGNAQQPFP